MLVREIMTSPAFSVRSDAPVDDGLRVMAERHVTALPVADDGRLVGVLSEIDVLRRAVVPDARAHARPLAETEPPPSTVGEIMTREPVTTTEGADVADLVTLFTTHSYKSLPVCRDGRLVGVISRSDVVRALWRPDDELRADVTAAFTELGQDRWDIDVADGVVTVSGVDTARERDVAVAIARTVLGVRRVTVAE